jgi:hypothetical protein
MFKLHAVQAQFGDSLILEFGTGGNRHRVLIDGGPPGNYAADLEAAAQDIVGQGGKIDLVVLSHIDNDHIVGLLDLLAGIEDDETSVRPRRFKIGSLWHNSFGRTLDPTGEISQRIQALMTTASVANAPMPLTADAFFGLSEGNRLRLYAKKLKVPLNKGFKKDLIVVESAGAPVKLGPLRLTVVGPTKANLEALRREWLEWLAKTEHFAAGDPATVAMADKSIPNLSSIVLLAECQGKKILLTGDARGDHIIEGLKTAGLTNDGKLHVDVLKVQHHGSDRNTTRRFFEDITADTYVISANGKHGNPDLPTLKWIVETARAVGRQISLFVTNATPTTKQLLQDRKPSDFGYTLETIVPGKHAIAITLRA